MNDTFSRRTLLQTSAGGGALLLAHAAGAGATPVGNPAASSVTLDLAPARWIWYPSKRCLPNTFVLFRRALTLHAKPRRATGWIVADSRYRLIVNGRRIQWGPAPSDPRWPEADPIDLTDAVQSGPNVIGAQVLYYGQGDGTWPLGKPGFLFRLDIETNDGTVHRIVSDASWLSHLPGSWQSGHYKRWYLRALQEEFDARAHPYGWTTADFTPDADWLPAMPLDCPPDKPAICSTYTEYMTDIRGDRHTSALRRRSIPLLREYPVPVEKLAESSRIEWLRPPEEYFDCVTPNAFRVHREPAAVPSGPGQWTVQLDGKRAAALTFSLREHVVGWPYFTIEAPAGTVIELMVHEAHEVGGPALLNTHLNAWTRFVCREGVNRFETFDYESARWIQLHIRNARGAVKIRDVGVRRRIYPWPNPPRVTCSEPPLQRLINASVNTLYNSAQDIVVDGMGRERQQYSGDGAHQLRAIYYTFGDTQLSARFVTTFSQGITEDGYFLDCWPAYDRLARLPQRQLHLTGWGPVLDHGVGFVFDCMYHHLFTGDREAVAEPYPRLLRFAEYLTTLRGADGLLPVENLGIPSVWIDHDAYRAQRDKQCAFNLYAAAMFQHALPPLCRAFGDVPRAKAADAFGRGLVEATVKRFWSGERGLFVNNLPRLNQDGSIRLCDRSLATSILYDQCPEGRIAPAARILADCPRELGFSYPANAGWRLLALAKAGRADAVVDDLRKRWATLPSVRLNNALQEFWNARPDSDSLWSHCGVVPLYVLFMGIAGIEPTAPGFTRCRIRPQLADLGTLHLIAPTVRGDLGFDAEGTLGDRKIVISTPPGVRGELVVKREEKVALDLIPGAAPPGTVRYRLPSGKQTTLRLKFT